LSPKNKKKIKIKERKKLEKKRKRKNPGLDLKRGHLCRSSYGGPGCVRLGCFYR
jgi:hypothetical protein